MTRLEEIKERLAKSTPGPWLERENYDYYQGGTYLGVNPCSYDGVEKVSGNTHLEKYICRIESDDFDKELLAHVPEDLAYLIERVEDLEKIIKEVVSDGPGVHFPGFVISEIRFPSGKIIPDGLTYSKAVKALEEESAK